MEKQKSNIWGKKIFEWDVKGKICWVLAFLSTGVLGYYDYLSMEELLQSTELPGSDSEKTFAILFALCLEGIPFFTASFASKLFLEYKIKKNDKRYAAIGFVLGCIGIVIAWGVALYIRYIFIQKNGGLLQFLHPEAKLDSNERYIADIFLQWSPIITSILAFLVSWAANIKDTEKKIKKELEIYHKNFLQKEAIYRTELEKLLNLRTFIWNSVTEYEVERIPIPESEQVFREEVIKRIRRQLILNSITIYPGEMERFQNKIEAELSAYLVEMALKSTNPELVLNIELKEVIQRYDEEQLQKNQPEQCWEYSKAGKKLEDELKRRVENRKPQAHSSFGLGGV